MKIGIKIGSALLAVEAKGKKTEAGLNPMAVMRLCLQLAELNKEGHQLFLVTSGAVISDPKTDRPNNLRASVGMARLISQYVQYLSFHGVETAQMLFTDSDLHADCRNNLLDLINNALSCGVIPIINANDTVDWSELNRLALCSDNDRLFMEICLGIKPDLAIIGFNRPAVLDERGNFVRIVNAENYESLLTACQSSGPHGHGRFGMTTKMESAKTLSLAGITTMIVPGNTDGFIKSTIYESKKRLLQFGTHFDFS